jgi:uncharacterized membrane protein
MKKRHRLFNTVLVLVAFLPLGYLALIWNRLPETVPLHFNHNMEPDRVGPKTELLIPVCILAAVSIFVLLLLQNLQRFDPKRRKAPTSPVFSRLGAGLLIFMAILNIMIIVSAMKGASVFSNYLFPLMGLLFAFLGNYMHNIKPNYFAGLRLPWTLSDDENWKKTHQLAGKIWFWCGLTFAIASLFLSARISMPLLFALVTLMVFIPAIYSYRLFRKKADASEAT